MFSEVREGRTRVLVPKKPTKSIFYNPKMELSRDLDVASVAAFLALNRKPLRFAADALAGTGIRGLRLACEVFSASSAVSSSEGGGENAEQQAVVAAEECSVVLNDRSKPAYEVIQRNIRLNGVDGVARASNEDANVLLHRFRFDLVDLDPFGSPAPFLDAACKSVRRLLLVTATDTAPLCGAHSGGFRKYDAFPLRTEYHSELATRILLGKVARELLKHEKLAMPLLCYAKRHFVRIVVGVERCGARRAEAETLRNLGFLAHCFSCGNRFSLSISEFFERGFSQCDVCGSSLRFAGPLFIGALHQKAFCEAVLSELNARNELNERKTALKIVERCKEELEIPFYYELHAVCKSLKVTPPPLNAVLESLRKRGFKASRTHFSNTAFKTDASISEIKESVKEVSHRCR